MSLQDFNVITSSCQIGEDFPYVHFEQIDCNLNYLNSCIERFENYIFQFNIYHNKADELVTLKNNLIDVLNYEDLNITNKLNNEFYLMQQVFTEVKQGIYEYSLFYKIELQTLFSNFLTGSATGKNLYAALFNRYNTTQLKHLFTNFTTTRYGNTSWERPFLYVPDYNIMEEMFTSCEVMDRVTFKLCYETTDPVKDYNLLDKIDQNISYSSLVFSSSEGQINTYLDWMGNDFEEIEPMLWRGCVKYELGLQHG